MAEKETENMVFDGYLIFSCEQKLEIEIFGFWKKMIDSGSSEGMWMLLKSIFFWFDLSCLDLVRVYFGLFIKMFDFLHRKNSFVRNFCNLVVLFPLFFQEETLSSSSSSTLTLCTTIVIVSCSRRMHIVHHRVCRIWIRAWRSCEMSLSN